MIGHDRPRLAVLVGPEESLSPAEIARSADGLADLLFVLDSGDSSVQARDLRTVANALAPTVAVDFNDLEACLDVLRSSGTSAVTTFTDRLCLTAAKLNAVIEGTGAILPPWGRKDVQRQTLRAAGVSRIKSARIDDEESLRVFVRAAGLPVVVKPTGGAASRDTWLLGRESDIDEFARVSGFGNQGNGLLAEQFIVGKPSAAPHLADYVSAEVFRSGSAGRHSGGPLSHAFVTDRLVPAWPCRETGLALPSVMGEDEQASVITVAERGLDALGATSGVFHVELKPARVAAEIIEVNGRLGGFIARLVRYGTGKDLGRMAISCVLHRAEVLDLSWDRCVLVLLFQPPARAHHIVQAPSRREILRRPGVLAVDKVSGAGTTVDWRNGTNFAIAWLWLAADSHAELLTRLVDAAGYLTDEFAFADSAGQVIQDRTWLEQITQES